MTAKHVPTDETKLKVEAAACTGANQKLIARYIGIDEDTLVKYYKDILESAMTDKTIEVVNSLLYNCIEKKKEASIFFWLKCRARWKESVPDTDQNIVPEPVNITFNVQPAVGDIKITEGKND